MRFSITLTVDGADAGQSLVDWLAYMLVDETRESVLESIREGRVAIDRVATTDANTKLADGTSVSYQERPADGSAVDWSHTGSAGEVTVAERDES